jgi:hypothetical protein
VKVRSHHIKEEEMEKNKPLWSLPEKNGGGG